jgi:hypothetical protein
MNVTFKYVDGTRWDTNIDKPIQMGSQAMKRAFIPSPFGSGSPSRTAKAKNKFLRA